MRDQPNILFIIADHHRWDWLGCERYGIPVQTPNLDALAGRGMMFDQCRCTSPLCAPSRASLATGLRPHRTGVFDNRQDLPVTSDTFMKRLRDAGYRVGACGKTDLHKATPWDGTDGWTPRMAQLGFTECIDQAGKLDATLHGSQTPQDPYMQSLHDAGMVQRHIDDYARRHANPQRDHWPSPLGREHHTDTFCGRSAEKLIHGFPKHGPWFVQVNFPGPHAPYDAIAEIQERYADVTFAEPVNGQDGPPREHQGFRRSFAAMIEYIDEWVGKLAEAVAARGELDNTLILYTSDHGEMLGDHGKWGKTHPQDPSVRVPLIVAGPRVRQGAKSSAIIELSDLAATFVELAGAPAPQGWDAQSLASVWRGDREDHRQYAVSMQIGKHWQMITDGQWKLVIGSKGTELYDLEADPQETHNIAADQKERVGQLARALRDELNAGK